MPRNLRCPGSSPAAGGICLQSDKCVSVSVDLKTSLGKLGGSRAEVVRDSVAYVASPSLLEVPCFTSRKARTARQAQ